MRKREKTKKGITERKECKRHEEMYVRKKDRKKGKIEKLKKERER